MRPAMPHTARRSPHPPARAFRIDPYDINVSLAPGERKTIVIKSPSLGDFPYYSDAPGDEGMKGNLTFYI